MVIASSPFFPVAELDNIETGRLQLRLILSGSGPGPMRLVVVDADAVSDALKIVALANLGLDVTSPTAASLVQDVQTFRRANRCRMPGESVTPRLGWTPGGCHARVDVHRRA